jgi:AcrR family transcriptional regulator
VSDPLPAEPPARRRPNRRGEGDRLREDLIAAAVEMIEDGQRQQLSLRAIARGVGIATTSVYLHFPDLDHVLAAVVARGFEQLTATTGAAARDVADPAEELRVRCRAYCAFALEHPNLYQVMFQSDLPLTTLGEHPANTPGRRSFENLVAAVDRCLQSGCGRPTDDPFRIATLIWTAEHGLVLARIARPTFPWVPIGDLVDDMVNRIAGVTAPSRSREDADR